MSLQFLQPYFGLGNGLQTKNVAGGGAGVGGWVELGRTTLGSDSATINVSSLPNKRYYMYLIHGFIGPRFIESRMRFNSDTGSTYSYRISSNGGVDQTGGNTTNVVIDGDQSVSPRFQMGYVSNFSTKEKLLQGWSNQSPTGAANAPSRNEHVAKWANTTSSINAFNLFTSDTVSDKYGSGSEIVVLGWDPADTHSNNFWTELGTSSVTTGDTLNITSGLGSKYLWIQAYMKATGGTISPRLSFNGDDASGNYSFRRSNDGAADATGVNGNEIGDHSSSTSLFMNIFVVNVATKEKLVIYHVVDQSTAGAGTAPSRTEGVGKWNNVANQITRVDLRNAGSGDYTTGTIIKAWGSN